MSRDAHDIHNGCALLGREVLEALERLWAGPFSPADLESAEIGIRAFLTSRELMASQGTVYNLGDALGLGDVVDAYSYVAPFGDHYLDYEFIYPEAPILLPPLDVTQSNYLDRFIVERFVDAATPKQVDRWIAEEAVAVAEEYAYDVWTSAGDRCPPVNVCAMAQYFLRCHRHGLSIYSTSVIAKVCNEFLFSVWPSKLFEGFEAEYRQAMREMRGPGIGIDLPPLTNLLLSRAPSRSALPETLRNLRWEYSSVRDKLWQLLDELWEAPTVRQQQNILRKLNGAADALFSATFPERSNVLSIALKLVQAV